MVKADWYSFCAHYPAVHHMTLDPAGLLTLYLVAGVAYCVFLLVSVTGLCSVRAHHSLPTGSGSYR